jgi:hypothetical protein
MENEDKEGVGAARPGHYPRLEAMIRAYAESEGITDLREAARHWYERVYRPMAARLRAAQLGRLFPGERTADLVVHLADLRAAEEERLGHPISWEEALDLLRQRYRRCQRHARLRLPGLHRLLHRRTRPTDATPRVAGLYRASSSSSRPWIPARPKSAPLPTRKGWRGRAWVHAMPGSSGRWPQPGLERAGYAARVRAATYGDR